MAFDSFRDFVNALDKAGELNADMIAVVRFAGPRAVGMPELHNLTPALSVLQGRGFKVALITECSMSDNVAVEYPQVEFVRPCNLCPHMKRITLKNIRHALETMTNIVTIPDAIAAPARAAVERMITVG